MARSITFDARAYDELRLKTQYEIYLIEAAFSIVGAPVIPRYPDQMIYPPAGGGPKRTVYGSGNCVIGDWREGFRNAGAPLIFSTTFKLMDMFLEWLLSCNGVKPGFRFEEKIRALKAGTYTLPPSISQHVCLGHRIIALYEKLAPVRNTITHNHTFTSSEGNIQVTCTKKGQSTSYTISKLELKDLSTLAVFVLRYVVEDWTLDEFRWKQLRWILDQLQALHGLPLLGQLQPLKLGVRLYRRAAGDYSMDLDVIRADAQKRDPNRDIEFDIRLVVLNADGSDVNAYLIPWSETHGRTGAFTKTSEELDQLACEVPEDVDPKLISDGFKNCMASED